MGFSVTGRVLNDPEGEGVADATVTLNNQIKGMQLIFFATRKPLLNASTGLVYDVELTLQHNTLLLLQFI